VIYIQDQNTGNSIQKQDVFAMGLISGELPWAAYLIHKSGQSAALTLGNFRLSAFGHRKNVVEAVERIKKNVKQAIKRRP
jgi:hypothetical protein